MARPKKVGLEYFPLDCQIDDKIEMLEAEHGMEGFGVYVRLLQYCYQQEDGKLDMSIVFRWKTLGKTFGILAENLRIMVDTMLEIDLFSRKIFDEEQKLTSNGIQKRLNKVSTLREKERLRKAEADSDNGNEFSSGKQGNSGRKSTQKESKEKKSNNSSASDDASGEKEYTLTHKIQLVVKEFVPGYYWSGKDGKHAQELAEKLKASFRSSQKKEPTDQDVLNSLSTLIKRSQSLTPFYQFQDIPKLNERYNATIAEIKKANPASKRTPAKHDVIPD